MPLAPFFHRFAVAAAQVLDGYDEDAIRERLEGTTVAISVGDDALASREGRALLDVTVRLLARLYPTLALSPSIPHEARALANAINPEIELCEGPADHTISIGEQAKATGGDVIYAGSDGWDGTVSRVHPFSCGDSANPIGAGISACLAAATLFRAVFLDDTDVADDQVLSGLDLTTTRTSVQLTVDNASLDAPAVLVGAGAIGNGALWALGNSPLRGQLIVVDPEIIELSNLQRYALTCMSDVGQSKVDVALRSLARNLKGEAAPWSWQEFVMNRGSEWRTTIVALDTARDRRAVQASLPEWIANAWTQPGDLGVSTHPWTEEGGCLSCLYLPQGETPSEDKLIASALGLPRPDVEGRIRQILWANGNPPRDLLEQAAAALDVPIEKLLPFEARPLRELYVEGICGGVVLPLSRVGAPTQDVHVPLAHQSVLAGVLLAGRLLARAIEADPDSTQVTRIDVLRTLGDFLTQPMLKDPRGICICQDPIYRTAYDVKWQDG